MFSNWNSRLAVLAFTTVSACGAMALAPLLWSDDVISSAIADQSDSDCTSEGGIVVPPSDFGSTTLASADEIFSRDADGDGVADEALCWCDHSVDNTCKGDLGANASEWTDVTATFNAGGAGLTALEGTLVDCDDDNELVYADDDGAGTNVDAMEICDGLDNDCDGTIDNDGDITSTLWFADTDNDGFGDNTDVVYMCSSITPKQAGGRVKQAGDCDDTDNTIFPFADGIANDCVQRAELCNGIDDDGDGTVDEGWPTITWTVDADGDGQGSSVVTAETLVACEWGPIEGYASNTTDCDDTDATQVGGSVVADNGLDEGCTGADTTVGGTLIDYRQDLDADGHYDASVAAISRSDDAAAATALAALGWYAESGLTTGDCDDTDAIINPGMAEIANDVIDNDCDALTLDSGVGVTEVCDGYDNDGDGVVDNGMTGTGVGDGTVDEYADLDNDGEGDPNRPIDCGASTSLPFPTVAGGGVVADCDDTNPDVHPSSTVPETCGADGTGDGIDYDCDGKFDGGYTASGETFPAETESCDQLDNDCDGTIDNGTTPAAGDYFPDYDHDGIAADGAVAVNFCTDPTGGPVLHHVLSSGTDCNDTDSGATPSAQVTYYADVDGDGDGDENDSSPTVACESNQPANTSITNTDCDDGNDQKYDGFAEICDGLDNNCDGVIDEGLSPVDWYTDTDGDDHGDENSTVQFSACAALAASTDGPNAGADAQARASGFATTNDDCDDADVLTFTGATELCDGLDNNCDNTVDDVPNGVSWNLAQWYVDADGDTYGSTTTAFMACDALATTGDGPSGGATARARADGFSLLNTDCYDMAPTGPGQQAQLPGAGTSPAVDSDQIFPLATETWYDDIDQDCGNDNDYDQDGDNFADEEQVVADFGSVSAYQTTSNSFANETHPATDCEDDPAGQTINNGVSTIAGILIFPGASDTFYDNVDQDCGGNNDYDGDGDGHADLTQVETDFGVQDTPAWEASRAYGVVNMDADDCDDSNLNRFPGNSDLVSGGVDNNCDGVPGVDADTDSFASVASGGTDCLDTGTVSGQGGVTFNANEVRPNATESWYDDIDENCDGENDFDQDGDGQAADDQAGYSGSDSQTCAGSFDTGSCTTLADTDCDDTSTATLLDVSGSSIQDPFSNGIDNNCDGVPGVDSDGDGFATDSGSDCNDADPLTFSGADEICGDGIDQDCAGNGDTGVPELCDGVDNDCVNGVDDGFVIADFFPDTDGDGFGDLSAVATPACTDATLDGLVKNDGDCDDSDITINPDALEVCADVVDKNCDGSVGAASGGAEIVCNGLDDNCDGNIDEGAPALANFYVDLDGDGFGATASGAIESACAFAEVPGYSKQNGDCDDANPGISPGATEICQNGIDEDCTNNTPDQAAIEICDGFDNDCAGGIDNGLPVATFYVDADGDGYGDSGTVYVAPGDSTTSPQYCVDAVIAGATRIAGDCLDSDENVNPGMAEVCSDTLDNDCDGVADGASGADLCNGIDDDCNGTIDDAEGAARVSWYVDRDRDGFGDVQDGSPILACAEADPDGFPDFGRARNRSDCDDFDASINPDAIEVPELDGAGNFINPQVDQDCDISVGEAALDVCDGVDNDGDGEIDEDGGSEVVNDELVDIRKRFYVDLDGDGFGDDSTDFVLACDGVTVEGRAQVESGVIDPDCNDLDPRVYPGAIEVCDDFEADGTTPVDTDCDGVAGSVSSPAPSEGETCDGIDNDCDGSIDEFTGSGQVAFYTDADGDGDGAGASVGTFCAEADIDGLSRTNNDCQDRVPSVSSLAFEDCSDGFDNNCDGTTNSDLGGVEVCNGVDDDCLNGIDDGLPDTADYFLDADGDGAGNPDIMIVACPDATGVVEGYVLDNTDCDDGDAAVNTSATEVCNFLDDNCDGTIDTDTADTDPSKLWYADSDGDGYGSRIAEAPSCNPLPFLAGGFTRDSRDCVDSGSVSGFETVDSNTGEFYESRTEVKVIQAANINPGMDEVWYDEIDQDCAETGLRTGLAVDADQDGDGQVCNGLAGYPAPDCPPYFLGFDCADHGDLPAVVDVGGTPTLTTIPSIDVMFVTSTSNPRNIVDTPYDGVNQTCRETLTGEVADDFDADGDGFSSLDEVTAVTDVSVGYVYDATLRAPATDCDDTDEFINPGAPEVCDDNIDNDCDGKENEFGNVSSNNASLYYPDVDGDLFGDEDLPTYACLSPENLGDETQGNLPDPDDEIAINYIVRSRDCDDTDSDIKPGGTEIWYDGVIQNCDTPNDFDQDGDGFASITAVNDFFNPNNTLTQNQVDAAYDALVAAEGWDALPATDCFDNVAELAAEYGPGVYDGIPEVSFPGRLTEECDGIDNDCDDDIDESAQLTDNLYYLDEDGDSFGNDFSPAVPPTSATPYGTGYGDNGSGTPLAIFDCKAPSADYVLDNTDCLDAGTRDNATSGASIPAGSVFPFADDTVYDGVNESCAPANDFDKDGDEFADTIQVGNFGDAAYNALYTGANAPGPLYPAEDCDDQNIERNPDYVNSAALVNEWAGDSVANNIDDDCDGVPGDDQDGDGVPSEESGGHDCYDVEGGDINGIPADEIFGANNNPGFSKSAADEVWYDDVDQNCDDLNDFDRDQDLFASETKVLEYGSTRPSWDYEANSASYVARPLPATDCEDGEALVSFTNFEDGLYRRDDLVVQSPLASIPSANIRPNATEVYYDGIDQDCDGDNDFDVDGDDFANDVAVALYDLNSSAALVDHDLDPSTPEIVPDPDDLFGTYNDPSIPASDCNDNNVDINPLAEDPAENGIDNNCDGTPGIDVDGDGFAAAVDCDDTNGAIFPGAAEVCEAGAQIDNDCDGNPNTVRVEVSPGVFESEYVVDVANSLPQTASGQVIQGVLTTRALYFDGDNDGFGDENATEAIYVCRITDAEDFYADNTEDCDDGDENKNPDATEVCNSLDDNCNLTIDEPTEITPTGTETYFRDGDSDGYGPLDAATLEFCPGYVINAPIDDRLECGHTDVPDPQIYERDEFGELVLDDDGDPIVTGVDSAILNRYGIRFGGVCWSVFNDDCKDSDPAVHPAHPDDPDVEIFDGQDNDCDGFMPVVELDCDNDGQLAMLPIPAGNENGRSRAAGVWTDPIESPEALNCASGAVETDDSGVCSGIPADPTEDNPIPLGLMPCSAGVAAPQIQCFGGPVTLECVEETNGFYAVRTSTLPDDVWDGASRIYDIEDNPCSSHGDCDDRADTRCVGRAERCDGVDNNCSLAEAFDSFRDANRNGLPDHMEDDNETPGYVAEVEIDFDGDDHLECLLDSRLSADDEAVTLEGGTQYETAGGDCNNTCALLNPEVEAAEACNGFSGACGDLIVGTDGDRDDYRSCGVYGDPDSEFVDEHIYVLTYAERISDQTEFTDEEWDVIPLVPPRSKNDADGEPTGEPVECDVAHHEALTGLLGVDPFDEGVDYGNYLDVCVSIDTCRQFALRTDLEAPDFCADYDLDKIRCVTTRLTLTAERDSGIFEEVFPDCLDAEAGPEAWNPDQVIQRSLWSKDRIVDARRVVVEWDCYRHTGDFGCNEPADVTRPNERALFAHEFLEAGGFNADDRAWRNLDSNKLNSDDDNVLYFNRFDPAPQTDGLMLGCWGDPTVGGVDDVRGFEEVGGDCYDAAEDQDDASDFAVNRDQYEGPDDLLAIFDKSIVDCEVCTDGLDNNCNGISDCAEPACARCFNGLGSGCGGTPCEGGGCSSTSTGGISSTGGVAMLMLMLGLGWRRRRDGEEDDAA